MNRKRRSATRSRPSRALVLSLFLVAAGSAVLFAVRGPRGLPLQDEARSTMAWAGLVDLDALFNAIAEMDVERARKLSAMYQDATLTAGQSHQLGIARTRLALYVGDCDGAQAIASGMDQEDPQVAALMAVASRCAGAVAGSGVVEDPERGLWIRVQDAEDQALVPFVSDVAVLAREAVRRDLGVRLPEPLRIDIVRDLFSLSAVSGLPLEAAETTGTVAVARWGRVTLLSPRAASHGYPWEDTLGHELVHLALSRATQDKAPLWLQEGVAKRQETRWRPERPFEEPFNHDRRALRALLEGQSVGITNLGPSIAMLDSASAATIAFAEVTSFINYWIEKNGRAAFRLLLSDLKGLPERDPDSALRSVSGYGIEEWILRWQHHLLAAQIPPPRTVPSGGAATLAARRGLRLGDLLLSGGHFAAATEQYDRALSAAPEVAALRARSSEGHLALGDAAAALSALGREQDADGADAAWFALRGRLAPERGSRDALLTDSRIALGLDPLSEIVACEGYSRSLSSAEGAPVAHFPVEAARRRLCEAARARLPVR